MLPSESKQTASGALIATSVLEEGSVSPAEAAEPLPRNAEMAPLEKLTKRTTFDVRSGTYRFAPASAASRVGVFIVAAVAAPPLPDEPPTPLHVPA